MSLWILDTDHVSLVLRGHPQVSRQVAETGAPPHHLCNPLTKL